MNTVEMWTNAQNSGYVYECPEYNMLYSKKAGLVENDDYNDTIYMDNFVSYMTLDKLMSLEWRYANNFMTIEEAEKKYGIKIIRTNT